MVEVLIGLFSSCDVLLLWMQFGPELARLFPKTPSSCFCSGETFISSLRVLFPSAMFSGVPKKLVQNLK